jgi:HEAT repeat protein
VVVQGRISNEKSAVELMNKGVEELETTFRSLFRVYGGTATIWRRSLDSAEPDEQILAVRLLARDHVAAAVESIGKLLDDPREQVAEAAAAALGDMGEESAVPVLIRSMNPRVLRSEVRAIESMARIGGKEASAYLEMTAEGHENPEVRELSKDALARMRKKH